MRITIKNLKLEQFIIDASDDITVLELKRKIFETKGADYAVAGQRLIYAGHILSDEQTVASYSYKEAKYVVCMINRCCILNETDNKVSSADSTNNDEEKLVDLATGNVSNAATSSSSSCISAATTSSSLSCINDEASQPGNYLQFLGNNSRLLQMREVVRNNPHVLGALLMELSCSNPDLFDTIVGNQDEFVNMLSESGGRRLEGIQEEKSEQSITENDNSIGVGAVGGNNECSDAKTDVQETVEDENTVDIEGDSVDSHVVDPNSVDRNKLADDRNEMVATCSEINGDQNKIGDDGDRAKPDDSRTELNGVGTDLEGGRAEFDAARVGDVNVAAANTMNANRVESAHSETETGMQSNSSSIVDDDLNVITAADRLAITRLAALGFDELTVLQAYFACERNEEFAANFLLNDLD